MKKYNKILFSIFLIIIFSIPVGANTTRDIGNEPELDLKLVSKWIVFYTNIERIKNQLEPVQYNAGLEQAAYWQAEYCVKIKTLDHVSSVTGMRTPKDRIEHFGERCGNCGENLTVKFAINSEGISYIIRKDEHGIYFDYGSKAIKWRNEQEMGYTMVDSWMKSPGHRKNILTPGFKWIGAGTVKGLYNNNKSYYGCQVFNGYGGLPHNFFKSAYELNGLEIKRSTIGGKNSWIINYSGEMLPGVIEVNEDNELKSYNLEKKDNGFVFIRNSHGIGKFFVSLYDKQHDIIYPMELLK